ncbi:MAG: hypothetical protein ABI072_04810 [Edaphobacter sp.]
MTNTIALLRTESDYKSAAHDIASCVHTDRRLPDQVFKVVSQHFGLFDFDEIFEERFWGFLLKIAASYDDRQVTLEVVEPEASYFKQHFGYFGAAVLDVMTGPAEYQRLFTHEPDNSPADALRHSVNAISFCSPSHQWAVWAQRDIGVGSVVVADGSGLASHVNGSRIRLFSADEALESLVAPNFLAAGIPHAIIENLRKNYPS